MAVITIILFKIISAKTAENSIFRTGIDSCIIKSLPNLLIVGENNKYMIKTYYIPYKKRKELLSPETNWFIRFKKQVVFGEVQYHFGILGLQIWNASK